jgi:large conductance mechanosensitive channel
MSLMRDSATSRVKGNVIDLAVAVIIGAAFGKIVDSLVKDIIMPVDRAHLRRPRLRQLLHHARAAAGGIQRPMTYEALTKAGVPLLAYGNFVTVVINFIILAFVIFWMVRQFAPPRQRSTSAARPRAPEEVLSSAGDPGFASQVTAAHSRSLRRLASRMLARRRAARRAAGRRQRSSPSTSSQPATDAARSSSSSRAAPSASCATACAQPRRSSTCATLVARAASRGCSGSRCIQRSRRTAASS